MRKRTIYRQFIISFLLIMVPIIICGCILIMWQKYRIEKEIEKNVSSEVYYGTKRLETQVESIKTFQYYLTNDKDLSQFVRQYDIVPVYDYYTLLNTVKNRLDIFQEGNPSIEHSSIYFRDIGIAVSHSGMDYVSESEYKELRQKIKQTEGLLRVDNNQFYSSQVFSYLRWDKNFEMILDVHLSNDFIFNSILNQNPQEDSNFLIYDHESEEILYAEGSMEEELIGLIRSYAKEDNQKENIKTLRYKNKKYLLISRYSDYLNQSVYHCSLEDEFEMVDIAGVGMLVIYLLFSGVVAFMFPYSVKRIVTIPVQRLISAFHSLSNNNLEEMITYRAADEFNYLYDEFNSMVIRLKDLIDENYKSKLLAQKAELKQLQSQIHPHFLYNTYFMLHRMILDEDMEGAAKLSNCLGIYMEYLAHNSEQEVSLSQELYYVRSYLDIQHLRFEGRMKLTIDEIPEEFRDFRIPRLTLQPVVENYLKYGYEMSDAAGELYIRFAKEENEFCITIGGGCVAIEPDVLQRQQKRLMAEESEGEVSGLINIHRRIKIRFGNDSGIYLHRDTEGRLVTRILIYCQAGGENV